MNNEHAAQRDKEPSVTRRRPIKFTPERLQQIQTLVERGKSRDEIAELLGVTVGSLQVTCSKLRISLRRPRFDNGVRLLRRLDTVRGPIGDDERGTLQPTFEQSHGNSQSEPTQPIPIAKPRERPNTLEACSATIAIRFQYRGRQQTTELPLTPRRIVQLALEAGLRDMTIGEFIGELIAAMVQKDLFASVLDNILQQNES